MVLELRLMRGGASLRLGRVLLRTWAPYRLQLPDGYDDPFPVYLVEWFDERDSNAGQLGGFTTLEAAEECMAQLESEGKQDLYVNMVGIHQRLTDWHYDR